MSCCIGRAVIAGAPNTEEAWREPGSDSRANCPGLWATGLMDQGLATCSTDASRGSGCKLSRLRLRPAVRPMSEHGLPPTRNRDDLHRNRDHPIQRKAPAVDRQLLRYDAGLIVGVRFMYGIRTVGPIVIGMSHVLARRFLIFNLIGAAIWSVTVAGGGFLFGQSLRLMLERIEGYEGLGALLIVGLAALLGGVRYVRSGKK